MARIDNLEFLADVVPRTIPYKQYKEKKSREAVEAQQTEAGQTTLDGTGSSGAHNDSGRNGEANGVGPEPESVQKRVARLDLEIRGGSSNGVNGTGEGHWADDEDVAMEGS